MEEHSQQSSTMKRLTSTALSLPGFIISSPSLNATDSEDLLFRLRDVTPAKFALPSSMPSDEILLL